MLPHAELGSAPDVMPPTIVTQTLPSAAAMPSGVPPIDVVRVTEFVAESIRKTVPSRALATHSAPSANEMDAAPRPNDTVVGRARPYGAAADGDVGKKARADLDALPRTIRPWVDLHDGAEVIAD
jgi:hypothetical protein